VGVAWGLHAHPRKGSIIVTIQQSFAQCMFAPCCHIADCEVGKGACWCGRFLGAQELAPLLLLLPLPPRIMPLLSMPLLQMLPMMLILLLQLPLWWMLGVCRGSRNCC
jgi:hypothetical protein